MTDMDKKEVGARNLIQDIRRAQAMDDRAAFAALCFVAGLEAGECEFTTEPPTNKSA